jgi:hypothetical protein
LSFNENELINGDLTNIFGYQINGGGRRCCTSVLVQEFTKLDVLTTKSLIKCTSETAIPTTGSLNFLFDFN